MSELLSSGTMVSLQTSNIELRIKNKKINKIKKTLLNLGKEEIASFKPLKVKSYKEEIEDNLDKIENKIPSTFKFFSEDYKKQKEFFYQIKPVFDTPFKGNDSVQLNQIDSSDLVNSE